MSNLTVQQTTMPTVQEFQTMKELGKMAVGSGFLPAGIRNSDQAVIIMLKGRELGIPAMQAFSSIAVINGKPTMSAELMLSMIYRNVPGAVVNFLKTDETTCEISAKRPSGTATTFKFSMEDARRANLTGKGPWVTYPAAMLRARCISSMARAMFPDALSGVVYTAEELGANVDDEGAVIDTPLPKANEIAVEHEELPPDDPSDIVIDFGDSSIRGKHLSEIELPVLAATVGRVLKKLKDDNKKPNAKTQKFLTAAQSFIEEAEFSDHCENRLEHGGIGNAGDR